MLGAPEKNSHGLIRSNSAKGGSKKKRKGGTDDLSKGGIDGGLRYLMVLPFPIASVEATGRDSAGLQMTALLQKVQQCLDQYSYSYETIFAQRNNRGSVAFVARRAVAVVLQQHVVLYV